VKGEVYALDTLARKFSMTRQMLINDDLNAFGDFNRAAGRMTAETENEILFDILAENSFAGPTMAEDSATLFHADHENLGSAVALDIEGLEGAIKRFRLQRAAANEGEHRPYLSIAHATCWSGRSSSFKPSVWWRRSIRPRQMT
jgi:hypothetical protein